MFAPSMRAGWGSGSAGAAASKPSGGGGGKKAAKASPAAAPAQTARGVKADEGGGGDDDVDSLFGDDEEEEGGEGGGGPSRAEQMAAVKAENDKKKKKLDRYGAMLLFLLVGMFCCSTFIGRLLCTYRVPLLLWKEIPGEFRLKCEYYSLYFSVPRSIWQVRVAGCCVATGVRERVKRAY